MRIAFEVDGVLADLDAALARASLTHFGVLDRSLTASEIEELWIEVRGIPDFWESLEELEPGSLARLETLAVAGRWHLVFLARRTQTPETCVQLQTQRWLAGQGISCPCTVVVAEASPAIAEILELDLLVVATAAFIPEDERTTTRTMLIDRVPDLPVKSRPLPRAIRPMVETLDSLASCLHLLDRRAPRRRRVSLGSLLSR